MEDLIFRRLRQRKNRQPDGQKDRHNGQIDTRQTVIIKPLMRFELG